MPTRTKPIELCLVLALGLLSSAATAQTPVGTAFTYQGRLMDAGVPASGTYDLRFALYAADVGGSPLGPVLARDDVTVAAGLFTVRLDFGTTFDGDKRFLEIEVRPGASGGGYTTLGGRQELTPTPYATRAADAGTIAGLTCANDQVLKWSGTGWTCGPDLDTNSGGTVTSVGTGAGLTGGPITSSGSIAVVFAGTGSSSTVARGDHDHDAAYQPRITATCPPGQYLRGINPDGTLLCEGFLSPPVLSTPDDPANAVGGYTDIAIGPAGLPVISHRDATAGALKVTLCGNPSCSAGNKTTTVDDSADDLAYFTSIAIGSDGLPIVSYWDYSAYSLKVAHCGDAACSASNTLTTVDGLANHVGWYTSIAIGTDGLPVISYHDGTIYALKVAKCGDVACSAGNTLTTVDDPVNHVGLYTSIAIGTDGLPVISYQDETTYALKVAKCGDVACSAGNTITAVDDPSNAVGYYTSIAVGTDGLPVVSYHDATAQSLVVAKCGNAACSAGNTIATVDDPAGNVGGYTSIAIGTDGSPVISYMDLSARTLKVAKCGNAACSAGNTVTTVDDPTNQVGAHTSIAIGTDGLPVISYQDESAQTLKVAKCGRTSCQ